MALTYQDVMTADLSPLADVSDAWRKMGERFGELKDDYEKQVPRALANGKWEGVAFRAHQKTATATGFEYAAARHEALALASLLKQAHTKLTGMQKSLRDLVGDAEAQDFKVDSSGRATYVGLDKRSGAGSIDNDPDYARVMAEARSAEREWTERIADTVRAVDDADQGVRQALARAAGSVPAGRGAVGFNPYADGDLDKPCRAPSGGASPDGTSWQADGNVELTGPGIDYSLTGPGYGRQGMAKLAADGFHLTADGKLTDGNRTFSGIADVYGGARITGGIDITNTGVSLNGEASAGVRGMAEGRAEAGNFGAYGRGTGFAGAEASGEAKAGLDGFAAGGKLFAGAKYGVAGGGDAGGIGVGATAEGWNGVGVEGKLLYRDEDGKYKIGAKAGLGPGAIGLEFTVEPGKVVDTAKDAVGVLGDGAGKVRDIAGGVTDGLRSLRP
ncbi:hypothetical protein ABT390_31840 [Streptomyces aurantiacus]|uniref:PPE family domain-containing protein n=1 Tax=Streptomyces aurantiacus JA 4570 TaxID=1286094 RepID=S3ZIF6_9ACTN|nr:hypothetical protein [Streptomyces aurantiacus]EPH42938.1 hypothetical protein STRAU_4022 [Streptomyces aurantiacus JA 4570]